MSNSKRLAILDAGAQYGKVIDRRVRALNVESIILPMDTPAQKISEYHAIIISGGPQSVYSNDAPRYDPKIFSLGMPILGICYGMQLMSFALGGSVGTGKRREDGPCVITIDTKSSLFKGLKSKQDVLMSHGDSVLKLAKGFKQIAESDGLVAAIENPVLKMYGVQFHPEVDLTIAGKDMLKNFLFEVAGFVGDYTIEDKERKAIQHIKQVVGDKDVLVLVSGGVDSTVCAALLTKAIDPKKIHAIHIDTGFMRHKESRGVEKALSAFGLKLQVIDASQDFLEPLGEVSDPETKRKIIGDTFIQVSQKIIISLGLSEKNTVLAQGTLRPDLIESASSIASKKAETIKTHHNDTQLVRNLRKKGMVVEPLQELHKDEVRELGETLGLPHDLIWRQPFPGPGLAVRILCAKDPSLLVNMNEVNNALALYGTDDLSVTVLPVTTVGVQGDGRTYRHVAGFYGKADWQYLFEKAREIPKKVHEINRVVYIFGEKTEVPVTEITPTFINKETLKQLQKADTIVNTILLKYDLVKKLSQVPVILFPVNFGVKGARSIAIRTFITNDFMTGVPAVPGLNIPEKVIYEMVDSILKKVPGIARVVYDLTSKPPATTEWE